MTAITTWRDPAALLLGLVALSVLGVVLLGAWRWQRARRRQLGALQRSVARDGAILQAMPDGVLVFDQGGVIESLNAAAAAIFKCAAAKTLGRHASDLIPDFDGLVADMAGVAPALAIHRRTVDAHRLDGEVFPLELTCTVLAHETGRQHIVVLRDLSTQQGIERMKHTFVSVVSHELRTPLTSIRGALALLADGSTGELPADAQAMVVMASRNCERLVDLVRDILDLDKMRTGQLVIEPEVLDLIRLLRETLRATLGYARLYKVRLLMPAQSGPIWVSVDPRRMAQVMGNLLSNAIKFSPEGGEVSVRLHVDADRCTVSVVDQGPGIPTEFRSQVFEKFAQADATNTRARGGSGLGLSITRALVERMDGRIGFDCPTGGGTVFHVTLPLAPAPSRPADFSATGLIDLIV